MAEGRLFHFPFGNEDPLERVSQRPPFGHLDDEQALVVDSSGNQNSPEGMTDGMELLDLFEAYVSHDGYGPEAYQAWIDYAKNIGRTALEEGAADGTN